MQERNKIDDQYTAWLRENIYRIQIPAEAKAAFLKYTKSNDSDEIRKLRLCTLYHIFNSEAAFRLAKSKEDNIDLWYHYMVEVLEPDITKLNEREKQSIIASLTYERTRLDNTQKPLCEKLMKYI